MAVAVGVMLLAGCSDGLFGEAAGQMAATAFSFRATSTSWQ